MITFPAAVRVPILNHVTGRPYDLTPAAELNPDAATLARIVAICNEPEVYDWLFREPLEGRPYPEEMARQWIEWSKAGWLAKTHFVFVVRDERKGVAAACDIKSNAPNAEIGYWSSRHHRGVMTNAVAAMCSLAADAGFLELFARTKQRNLRSQAVLARAGFERSHDRADDHVWFTRALKARAPNA
jgi:RimJ/RimL family protein N-acetyltransferase